MARRYSPPQSRATTRQKAISRYHRRKRKKNRGGKKRDPIFKRAEPRIPPWLRRQL